MKLKEVIQPIFLHTANTMAGMSLYFEEYHDQFLLNEGMHRSQPREKMIEFFEQTLKFQVLKDDPDNIIIRLYKVQRVDIDKILKWVYASGWNLSSIQFDNGKVVNGKDQNGLQQLRDYKYNQVILVFEALYGVQATLPKFLYHATPFIIWDTKIKTNGLSPRTSSMISSHPDRVYYTTSVQYAIAFAQDLAQEKLRIAKAKKYNSDKFSPEQYYKHWAILEIDTTKLPNIRGFSYFQVFEDPNSPRLGTGHIPLYSPNTVPPNAIKLIKQFDVY